MLVFRRSLSVALEVRGVRRTQGAMRCRAFWIWVREGESATILYDIGRMPDKHAPDKYARIQFAGDDFFVATTPSGHSQVIDVNGQRNSATGPLEMLLVALGGCT